MKPSQFFQAMEDVGVPMTEEILGARWDFNDIHTAEHAEDALSGSIYWYSTLQGENYWEDIYNKLVGA